MTKKHIKIDADLCIGCGSCANTCHQSAIEMVDGKAKVVREASCDGLGRCLPVCPAGAISFVETAVVEVPPCPSHAPRPASGGCPGSRVQVRKAATPAVTHQGAMPSQLNQWPVQLKLLPTSAPFYQDAHLLVAADCTAFSCGNFHQQFMAGKTTVIGCPKLDEGDYTEKLTQIIAQNQLASITVVRMEVPCCGGLDRAVRTALAQSGKAVPCETVVLSLGGEVLGR